jgi:hypothetical protein
MDMAGPVKVGGIAGYRKHPGHSASRPVCRNRRGSRDERAAARREVRQQVMQLQVTPRCPEGISQVRYGDTQVDGPRQAQLKSFAHPVGTVTQWFCGPVCASLVTHVVPAAVQAAQLVTPVHWVASTQPPV